MENFQEKEFEEAGKTYDRLNGISITDIEKKLFTLSQQAYKQSQDYFDSDLIMKIARRYNMYNSVHNNDSKYCKEEYKRNKHYVPKSHEFVKNFVAQTVIAYFDNPEFAYLEAELEEDLISVMSAEYFSFVMLKRLKSKRNWWLTFIQMTAQGGSIHNFCAAKVDWDTNLKQPIAVPINIEKLRIDPNADPLDPISDTSYIIYQQEMYIDEILEKQEKDGWKKISVDDLQSNFASENTENDQVELSRYREGYNPRQGIRGISNELNKVNVHENIIRYKGKYKVFYTLGTTKLLSDVYDLEKIYPQGIPYVIGVIFPEESKIYSASPLDHAYQSQVLINDYTNIAMDGAEDIVRPVTLFRASSGFDVKRWLNAGSDTAISVRDTKDVTQLNKQIAPQGIKEQLPYLMTNFDTTVGGLASSTLALEGQQTTATSQLARSRSQSQVLQMYLTNYNEKFIVPVLELMLKCEKIFGLKDKKFVDNVFKKLKLLERYQDKLIRDGIDFEVNDDFRNAEINLHINVGMGAVTPQMRAEMLLATVSNLRANLPTFSQELDEKEIAKMLFSLNGEKNLNRFIKVNEENQEVIELQNQLQQLQQELMNAKNRTPEEIQANIERINADVQEKYKQIEMLDAQISLIKSKAVATNVGSQKDAVELSMQLAAVPEAGEGADKALENAGMVDPTPQDPMIGGVYGSQEQGVQNENPERVSFVGTQPFVMIDEKEGEQ